jgi:hypothetical protein
MSGMSEKIEEEIDAACVYARSAPWPTFEFVEGGTR